MPQEDICSNISEEVSFTSDDFVLKGTLRLPADTPEPPVVIGAHGLFSNRNSPKQVALAEACCAHGIAYFRFDHRGCGESEGDFREVTSLGGRCNDLISAANAIRQRADVGKRLGLFGSSLGGTVCLLTGASLKADALVTFATPLRGEPILRAMEEAGENEPHADEDPGRSVNPDVLRFDVTGDIKSLRNILIFHGDSDKVVSPSEAHRIYQRAESPKRLIMFRDGDHRMTLKENQDKFIREALVWYKAGLKYSPAGS
ncbi:alpha/beta hydrolase [Desulfonema ishimotonii]|uniref:Alpha/beta hydrolase n=1 Tax=Desulfonema ishimotonii TaxID=45657 RepID=A0A401FWI8_9BACT|nr:alpha/beta fold hydrolase [Desulfonema ishimotonii]GBC61335.1 alpha/beta hydrolase [Desulfonema ishimotonii]